MWRERRPSFTAKKEAKGEGEGGRGVSGGPHLFIISDAWSLMGEEEGEGEGGNRVLPGNVSLIVNCKEKSPKMSDYKGIPLFEREG